MEDLKKKSVTELRDMARGFGMTSVTGFRKAELVEILTKLTAKNESDTAAAKEEKKEKPAKAKTADKAPARKGRPRKSAPAEETEAAELPVPPVQPEAEAPAEAPAEPEKKRRGRPKKAAAAQEVKPEQTPKEKPGEQPEERPEEKPAENSEEQPAESAAEKPEDQPEEQRHARRQRRETGQEQPQRQGTARQDSRQQEAGGDRQQARNGRNVQRSNNNNNNNRQQNSRRQQPQAEGQEQQTREKPPGVDDISSLDSGEQAYGILEIMPDGFGFIRGENYLPTDNDIYVSPSQIRRFNLRTGDIIEGSVRIRTGQEKFAALLYVRTINGELPSEAERRKTFEDLTPIFPDERIHLEAPGCKVPMRVVDLISPIGKGQRGMIVSPPKAGKTTLLKQIADSVTKNHPDMKVIILLIDERPEEVTDMKESIRGENVEVIYSTFDELPEHHTRVAEMVLARAKRLVEHGNDVMILLDSITRLSRAYNLIVTPSGRTLSGGLDPSALYMPKKFFGAARNIREGGSLTVLATALTDTGSRMDDMVFEEFKGTGNMEIVLDRKLSERRVFPAIDLLKSGTRRDDLLLTKEEFDTIYSVRKAVSSLKPEEATEKILELFVRTRTNKDFLMYARKVRWTT